MFVYKQTLNHLNTYLSSYQYGHLNNSFALIAILRANITTKLYKGSQDQLARKFILSALIFPSRDKIDTPRLLQRCDKIDDDTNIPHY